MEKNVVFVAAGMLMLEGFLCIPENATSIIVFVHGSGSSRHSPRNQAIADEFNEYGMATLLFDLLTPEEEIIDAQSTAFRFDIPLLADRVKGTIDWLIHHQTTKKLKIGLIGSSTGAAAALIAAAEKPSFVKAVVSRGGRPDLATTYLSQVQAPTLLIAGENDSVVIELNHQALQQLECEKKMELVTGASHVFEEPGTLQQASHLSRNWFLAHL